MTRQTTQTTAGDLLARYPLTEYDAAVRHAGVVAGHVDQSETDGCWEVHGDPHLEAQRVLRETPTATLLRKAYRITHAMAEAKATARANNGAQWTRETERDLRAQRDMITAEVLRRADA